VSQTVDAMNEEEQRRPHLLAMVALVAFVVAVVILVFFGIGYLFGRAYL
jgi:preprotein translocase subunit SecE